MWVVAATQEQLAHIIEQCACMRLVSQADGTILYANRAFREWSGYTMSELTKLGWKNLSVDDDDFAADIEELQSVREGKLHHYSVQKRYRKKDGGAHVGTLTVHRYPSTGEIQWFACTWDPHENGTAAAFSMAMERTEAFIRKLTELEEQVRAMNSMTDGEQAMVKVTRTLSKNPRLALALFVVLLTMMGAESVVALLQRLGFVPLPIPAAEKVRASNEPSVAAHQIAGFNSETNATEYQIETDSGIRVIWIRERPQIAGEPGNWRSESLSGAAKRCRLIHPRYSGDDRKLHSGNGTENRIAGGADSGIAGLRKREF